MLNIERMQYIIQSIQDNQVVYIKDLAKQFYRSESTIRRDMAVLEREGYLKRVHGGAIRIMNGDTHNVPYHMREVDEARIKRQIGKLAATHIKDHMHIMMDTSSTTGAILPYLQQKDLKIITNSSLLAMQAMNTIDGELYCTGGKLDPYIQGFSGETARREISQWHADVCFFSTRCTDLEYGCTDVNAEDVVIKQTMIKQSAKVIYVVNSGKFNRISPRHVCNLDAIDCIITEKEPDERWLEYFDKKNIQLEICPSFSAHM